jgi:hypothetical protein
MFITWAGAKGMAAHLSTLPVLLSHLIQGPRQHLDLRTVRTPDIFLGTSLGIFKALLRSPQLNELETFFLAAVNKLHSCVCRSGMHKESLAV